MIPTNTACQNTYQAARVAAGLTQEVAAELIEVAPKSIQMYESGERKPKPETVKRMVEVYAAPHLDKWYCVNQCPLGYDRQVPTTPMELTQVALMLGVAYGDSAELPADIQRLFKIAMDKQIDDHELEDCIAIEERMRSLHFAYHAFKMLLEEKLLKCRQRKTPERVGAHSGVSVGIRF